MIIIIFLRFCHIYLFFTPSRNSLSNSILKEAIEWMPLPSSSWSETRGTHPSIEADVGDEREIHLLLHRNQGDHQAATGVKPGNVLRLQRYGEVVVVWAEKGSGPDLPEPNPRALEIEACREALWETMREAVAATAPPATAVV